ncbi:MAG: hypothetical protein R2831_01385 [Chitinophagaceae bacterium]
MKKSIICLCLCIWSLHLFAQKKRKNVQAEYPIQQKLTLLSFELLENGDTINKIDSKHLKQGMWLEVIESRMQEEGYQQYGLYINSIKEGKWLQFDMRGKIISEEQFKQGKKDGEAKYYEEGKLFCVGNYLALKSKYDYDTIMVETANGDIKPVILKANLGSVKHGYWTFYDIRNHNVTRMVEYQADDIIYEHDYEYPSDSTIINNKIKSLPHISHEPQSMYWYVGGKKKQIQYTDISPNAKGVTPNQNPKKRKKL